MTHDRHSYAEPALVRTTHLELDLALDFDQKVLAGSATHTLAWTDADDRLVLDTRDLTVLGVEGQTADGWEPLEYTLATADAELGSALTIATAGHPRVKVEYRTAPTATGVPISWRPSSANP